MAEPQEGLPLPMERYRILDLGTAWAAPMAAQLLADMGAQVIKIESQARTHGLPPDDAEWPALQPPLNSLDRNKLSVAVNLDEPKEASLVKELAAQSDVTINDFPPSVLDRLGLGYGMLRQARPDIIVVSMSDAGEAGSLKDTPTVLALSGLTAMIGYEDGTVVGELPSPWSAVVAALHAAMAACAALRHRNLTGQGQHIEVSQWEATTSWLGEAVMDWTMNRRQRGPAGNTDPVRAPHKIYRCQGDDRWVSIAVGSDDEWQALCTALKEEMGDAAPFWTRDPFYAGEEHRTDWRRELDSLMERWTQHHTAHEITELLQRHRVAAFPVMTIQELFTDSHFRERQAWGQVEHPTAGVKWLCGQAWRLSETPGSVRRHAPLLGEHNREVFSGLLGVPEETLLRLAHRQVL